MPGNRPKRKNTTFGTRRKFEIEKYLLTAKTVSGVTVRYTLQLQGPSTGENYIL
jgi:hypothetical protein